MSNEGPVAGCANRLSLVTSSTQKRFGQRNPTTISGAHNDRRRLPDTNQAELSRFRRKKHEPD